MAKTTKKKSLTTLLVVVLLAVVAIGGMLAYLTDRDSEVNTFTVGDVKIDLQENFDQGSSLKPGVQVKKEVKIQNTGTNDAWVWYTIAYPEALDLTDSGKTILWTGFTTENHDNTGYAGENDGEAEWLIEWTGAPYLRYFTDENGVEMVEFTVLYQNALAAGETTPQSLECVYFDKAIDVAPNGDLYRVENGVTEKIDWNINTSGIPVIHINAYAIQNESFADVKAAYEAYQTQWGANGTEYEKVAAASNNVDLNEAIEYGAETVVLDEGTYSLPSSIEGKDVTLVGEGDDTVIDFTKPYNTGDASITFENMKFVGLNSNTMNGYGIQHTTNKIIYKNCTFENAVTNEFYGSVEYIDCTFIGTYYICTYAVKNAEFINCTFDRTDSRALLVYSHGDNPVKVLVKGCKFKADAKGYTGAGAWTAAVEVDTTNITTPGTTVTIEKCTADENYHDLVRDKSATGATPAVITVDGVVQ